MQFEHTDKVKALIARLEAFMDEYVYPTEKAFAAWNHNPENLWKHWPGLDEIKAKARAQGLWNLFLPREYGKLSPGLTTLEYAPLAEVMGRVPHCSQFFNCSAPDTGNMEVLAKYGTPAQQARWLQPLLDGEIRSSYVMTEPDVASSDATNVSTTIVRDGDSYVINGRKWYITGAMDPRCKVMLVMGRTLPDNPRHQQHSTIIVPRDVPGLKVLRGAQVFGSMHSPGGEAELVFDNVRVPAENLILGEGRGFEIAQGRLLTLKAADQMDRYGNKGAKDLIAAIKVVAPMMAQTVIDRAIQAHGAAGVSEDFELATSYLLNRTVRIADGPDEVHMSQLGKLKIREYNALPRR